MSHRLYRKALSRRRLARDRDLDLARARLRSSYISDWRLPLRVLLPTTPHPELCGGSCRRPLPLDLCDQTERRTFSATYFKGRRIMSR